jgi:hypothetical protein
MKRIYSYVYLNTYQFLKKRFFKKIEKSQLVIESNDLEVYALEQAPCLERQGRPELKPQTNSGSPTYRLLYLRQTQYRAWLGYVVIHARVA